jgi:hypothetical protein
MRRLAFVIVVIGLMTACSSPFAKGPTSSGRTNPPPASGPRISYPSPTPEGAVLDCPATIRNRSGSYRFDCPTGWIYTNCESTEFHGAFTELINPAGCRSEAYGVRMIVWGLPGQVSAEGGGAGTYVGTRQTSKNVVVDGVSGTRRTYLITKNLPLGPPKGTIQIVYTFTTGGETHFAIYNRYPKEADLTAAFDKMILTTLHFSAS